MTTKQTRLFTEGRALHQHWLKYYATQAGFYPPQDDIRRMSRELDLTQTYITKCIYTFLEN